MIITRRYALLWLSVAVPLLILSLYALINHPGEIGAIVGFACETFTVGYFVDAYLGAARQRGEGGTWE